MEFLGHQKALAFLLGTRMVIKSFISDRHQSIAKRMREECPKKCRELGKPLIDHFFDPDGTLAKVMTINSVYSPL